MRKQEYDKLRKLTQKGTKVQVYWLHLLDGSEVQSCEEYDCPSEESIVTRFEKASPNEMFIIGDAFSGYCYIPKSSIVYISTGEVVVIE